MNYYIVKVRIDIDTPKGVKKSTETYLVEAVSVTDAEVLVNKDFAHSGIDFEVRSVSKSQIVKIISKHS